MRTIVGRPASIDRFRSFEPVEVLYEFDVPRIFTVRDADGELNLVYWSEEDAESDRYIVVSTSSSIVKKLKNGQLSVFDALDQPRCWICDVNARGELTECRRIEFEEIPGDSLPAPGVLLLPDMKPLPADHVVQGRA